MEKGRGVVGPEKQGTRGRGQPSSASQSCHDKAVRAAPQAGRRWAGSSVVVPQRAARAGLGRAGLGWAGLAATEAGRLDNGLDGWAVGR
jgi:hypothetical protein